MKKNQDFVYVDLYIDKIIRLIPNKGNVIYNLLSSVLKEIISTSTSVEEIDLISDNSLRSEVASSCLLILKMLSSAMSTYAPKEKAKPGTVSK